MTRWGWAGKGVAVAATVVGLGIVLARISFLVDERMDYQREAAASVQRSLAGAQTLVGPVLRRVCEETWTEDAKDAKDAKPPRRVEQRRERVLQALPEQLTVDGDARSELRHRGLFKVNGYQAKLTVQARFGSLSALVPVRKHADSQLSCRPPQLWLATSDVRGLRDATLQVDGRALAIRPGMGHDNGLRGLHAELVAGFGESPDAVSQALNASLSLTLVGTGRLALVPAASSSAWSLRSDWPHPSFAGRFLPEERKVTDTGFDARWRLSALATSAGADLLAGRAACLQSAEPDCVDTMAVDFVDPVNPYVLSDRAIKYGLLFVVLTFAAVGLAETLGRDRLRRVHPVQYALVGLVLCLFFLLLLSLSEHIAFGWAYALACAACVPLLGVYAGHAFGRARDGWTFGGAMALLYAMLYVLLQREQTALLIGSLGLFAAVAAVMWLTRRVDWYALR